MKKKRFTIICAISMALGWMSTTLADPASASTKKANSFVLNHLPFNDKLDFEEASRGHIDNGPGLVRGDDSQKVYVWNITEFNFLNAHNENNDFVDSVNPSLWRHAQLNHYHGLFKVAEGIYQVRGYDISNVTFIEGKTGYIVVDPLVSVETARASLQLLFKHRGKKAIKAIIFSHPHVDHYGGVKGILSEEEIRRGKVPVIASIGFLEHAISENVFAGNAMSRRAKYMFGHLLPKGPEGHVDSGVGQALSSGGTISLVAPTDIIDATGQTRVIDGVTLVFQYTPGTEAPTEMNFYLPEYRALFMAENCNGTLHNLYTLRGAQVRDGKGWSFFLHEAAKLYGRDTDVMFTSHNWPKWGSERIVTFIKKQADMYKFIHDQTLHFANHGYTMNEIAEMVKLPPELDLEWDNRGYYGTVSHNSKAVYQRYLGWFDGNPAHLNPLPPVEAAKKYVDIMGGADTVLSKAKEYYDRGDYRFVAEVLNHVVFADPNNREAKELQAKTFEQLGYQSESGIWRNFYLTGARELRHGVQAMEGTTASPDTIKAMTVPLFFDYMAIRLDGRKAAGKVMRFSWFFTDTNEKYLLSLENGVLNHWQYNSKEEMREEGTIDASISLSRATFDNILLKIVNIQNAATSGMVRIDGDARKLDVFMSMLDEFNPNFNIVTP